jgi:hypothetical protein
VEDVEGHLFVFYEADFLALLSWPDFRDTPLAEIEELERSLLKRGVNIQEAFSPRRMY